MQANGETKTMNTVVRKSVAKCKTKMQKSLAGK